MKFGTSGLRGLSTELKGNASSVFAAAFGLYLTRAGLAEEGQDIVIGQDFRDSSPDIAANCKRALSTLGFKIVDCGPVPTPALALYAQTLGAAALMITGSHIPADRNGIKFYRPDGEIGKADEQPILTLAEELRQSGFQAKDGCIASDRRAACEGLFFERNANILAPNALAGMRIGVFEHSSVARDLIKGVLSHFGANVVALGRSESFVPVDTEALSPEFIQCFESWTRDLKLDAIVSTDGDGDRPLVVDERGKPLRGDLLGLVAAKFLNAETVVTPVTSNSGIERAGSYTVIRTRVGSPYVIEGMSSALQSAAQAVIGFEANGGLLTGSDFVVHNHRLKALPTRDSFLPILSVLSQVASTGRPLSAISDSFRLPYATAGRLENFPIESSRKLMSYLQARVENVSCFLASVGAVESLSSADGLRIVLRDERIIHFRPSGNAPEMRCYVEAENEAAAEQLLSAGLTQILTWCAS
ncbi:phosphomannomutase [Ensifer aridi]|uniref:phosphomannomutase n=1 Tax=Ensifer aridi TaxID=1708715 RepID=UPI0009C0A4FF|nr:phosphomannomutase [Ensifer aridi]